MRRRQPRPDDLLLATLARLDPVALGAASGVVCGLAVFAATAILLLKGGAPAGPNLALLAQYFPGYTVTPAGSLVGLLYGAASGFVLGWAAATLRNGLVAVYVRVVGVEAALDETSRAVGRD